MNHDHQDAACPNYVAAKNQKGVDKAFGPSSAKASAGREKLRAFLGVCGCVSCYVAMFPAILLGIIGIFGISSSQTLGVLNAYMGSALFQPILIISILLLIIGLLRYGKSPLWFSILGGIGIFISMNFFMHEWLFTISFALVALSYFFALRQTKSPQFKFAFILLVAVVILGVVDIGRTFTTKNLTPSQTQPQPTNSNSMDTMNQR